MKTKEQKPMQLHYNVDYELDGETKTETKIWCGNPGAAMAACLKNNPDAKIIKAWVEGYPVGELVPGYQEWLAPPVQREPRPEPRAARALKPNERGCELSFYDEVVTFKR